MPIFASNFASNSLSGTVRVINGFANITLPTIPYALEGDKSFVIKIRKDSPTGEVLSTSPPLAFRDSSSLISVTANVSSVAEGNLVAFSVVTANAVNGANLFYSVFPVTANVTADDFTANTGTFTIINNAATFALRANADVSLSNEDGETFKLQIRTTDSVGNVVFVTSNIAILDTYKTYNVFSFVENSSQTITEGTSVTFTFTATNIPNGTILHYSTFGNTTSFTSNTGSFVMNGTSNTFVISDPRVPYNTIREYSAVIRDGSAQGAIVATSNTINVIDETLVPLSASGGIQSNIDGHRLHIFTTSGNIAFNKTGAVEYLVIAGGGGGAYGGGTNTTGGGGGGAGGFLYRNSTELVSSTLSVVVGAAGTAGSYNTTAPNGSPSVFNADTAIGGGGGGGRQRVDAGSTDSGGSPGGSGGGGMYGTANFVSNYGLGTPGQGNPGGSEHPSYLRNSGGGGGAGGSGSQPSSTTNGGIGLTANSNFNLPASYGTPGPAPGRYFAGGGGGGLSQTPGQSPTGHLGGSGGGGNGYGAGVAAGTTNTGGGGGGGGGSSAGEAGGSGIVIIKYSTNITIPTFNVTASANSIVEGGNIVFTLNTINLSNNTLLYYYTLGNVISSDFVTGNTGSFRTTQNSTNIILQSNTNIPLNQERFLRLVIAGDTGTDATSLTTSNVFTITDGILTYNITTSSNFIYEGANAVFTLNTAYVPNNTLLYYYTVGNVLTSNFVTGNIGSFRTTQNRTNIILQSNTNIPANEERFLQLRIAGEAGTSATPLTTSNVFTIKDSNLIPFGGEGGTLITENGFNTHIFTTSGNITFNKTGTVEYMIVAGGGGGAVGGGTNWCGGGGGGAGGLIFSNNISVAGTTMSVVVGAGASTGGGGNAPGNNGSPSVFNSNTAIGGGGGGGQQNAGSGGVAANPGGSGGGGMYGTSGADIGYGTAGQGNPGGAVHPSYVRNSGGGGGAGGAGSIPSSFTNGGVGRTIFSLPSSYGTPGPAPGRYFAGGGGGGMQGPSAPGQTTTGHAGGAGGGGKGFNYSAAVAGTTNTGGGGGGGGAENHSIYIGGLGGSGIVIIRYPV